jgi:membrane protein required for colicin V production
MMSLSILDWVLVFSVLLSILQAIRQGFFYEFFSLAGVVAGYLLAAWEYPWVAAWYGPYVNSPWTADIAGFFTIFVLVMVLAGILGRLLRSIVRGVGLRWFDRLLGAPFGFIRGVLVNAVVVLALAAFAPQWGLQQSKIAPFLLITSRGLVWAAPADLRQRFWDGWSLLRSVPQHLPLEHGGNGRSL